MTQTLAQLQTVDDLATLLKLAQMGLGADDVADALWLAQFLPPADSQAEPEPLEPEAKADPSTTTIVERRAEFLADSLPVAPAPAPAAPNQAATAAPQGIPIQLPAAPALRSRRDLAKALRPLKRRVPSRTATVFDAEATAEQIAEQGIWTAVMAPAPERWLDLAIVVEQSRSTPLWQAALAELKLLTERQGAFRRVSPWQIRHSGGHPVLHSQWHSADTPQPTRKPSTLIDPAGRRLIWLVSDCTSSLWEQPTIYEWLHTWGQHGPTTLVQLFPGRLWGRTALGDGLPVRLSTFAPGVPNTQLQATEVLPLGEVVQALTGQSEADYLTLYKFRLPSLATVPVVSLEAYPLHQWAKVVAGSGDTTTPGYRFNAATLEDYQNRKRATAATQPSSAEDRVRQFHNTASPLAVKLAGLMSAAPVEPPIIQIIQETLLPQSQQVHVAEVYMSGLLKAITPPDLPPHQIQYDFLSDEVRDALTDRVPIAKTEAVLDVVSGYLSDGLGLRVRTYEALLLLDLEGRPTADQNQVVSFARIAKRALRRLGGDYAAFAEHIDAPGRPKVKSPAVLPRDFPELKTFEFEYLLIEIAADPGDPSLETFTYETVRVNNRGQVVETIPGTAQYFRDVLGASPDSNPPVLDMVAIPGGTFLMGSPEDESERWDNESPQHEVTVPAFFMAKTPITQAQWRTVAQLEQVDRELSPDPANFKGDDRPVEQVSWHDVTEFCARLSRLTGRDYRLPTEAEWEYACRAGTTTPFAFGETLTGDLANYNASFTYAQEAKGEYRQQTTPVGSFPPNAFGLYDMHGNVGEWCQDHWHSNYEGDPPTDGSAWLFSDQRKEKDDRRRMLRGGSWYHAPRICRSACRDCDNPDARDLFIGFRVVCSAARALS